MEVFSIKKGLQCDKRCSVGGGEHLRRMLVVAANAQVGMQPHFTLTRFEVLADQLEQCGLARSVSGVALSMCCVPMPATSHPPKNYFRETEKWPRASILGHQSLPKTEFKKRVCTDEFHMVPSSRMWFPAATTPSHFNVDFHIVQNSLGALTTGTPPGGPNE